MTKRLPRKRKLASAASTDTVATSGDLKVRWVIKGKKATKPAPKAETSVVSKRVRDADGKVSLFRFVDANSASFGSDFDRVFQSNVRKARRANKQVTGTSNGGVIVKS